MYNRAWLVEPIMKLRGLVIVIAGVLALFGALFGLATVAAEEARKDRDQAAQTGQLAARPTGGSSVPAPGDPSASGSASAQPGLAAPGGATPNPNAPITTYAGKVDGRSAAIAIAVRNGQAIAYLCDGGKLEAWLQGPAGDGQLALTGKNGATVTGRHDGTTATGTAVAGGRTFTFTVKMVQAPAGLYRIADKVANAAVNGGWIVADGEQTGTLTVDGVTTAAPPLNTDTGETTVNGVVVKPNRAQPPA
jgi:serine/threonine-protein kinase